MISVQFPDATSELASHLAIIHREAFGSLSWSEQNLRELLNLHHNHVGIAVCNECFFGFVLYSQLFDEAEILTIAVKPIVQRRKIGTQLIESLLEKLSKKEVKSVFLEVAENNLAALALYHYFGFTIINKRTHYYKGNLSALCMKKSLLV